jgi:alpha-mannosidase
MMRIAKTLFIIFILTLQAAIFCFSQPQTQSRIREVETLINDQISPWQFKEGEVPAGEKAELDVSKWLTVRMGFTIRQKVFWLGQEFKVPESFAGIKTKGSQIELNCTFRGVGKIQGQFYLNGELKESFDLEFGNHATVEERRFLVQPEAQPGEKMVFAFRFDNLGRLPLIERKEAEPGAFFQMQDARFRIEAAQEAHEMLSRFLLDLKTGASLLDLLPSRRLPQSKERPVSEDCQKFRSSKEFLNLKKRFEKALDEFDLDALRDGEFSKVESSLDKFYKEVKPISRFAKIYTVFIGGNSHIDLAWLWRWIETVEVSKETFSTIMDNMEEYPDIVYIQSQAQAYQWMEEYYPEVFERIKEKVKQGRWEVIGGMWAEPDCNLTDGESFIRQILYGKRYFKEKFGVDVEIGWNPDSFGYNWNMPQFFKKSGIDSFVTQKISWNDTTVFPYFFFWWEGCDGSKVLTYFPPTGYVGRLRAENIARGMDQFEKNTGYRDVFILYGLGNHGGGPNREMLDRAEEYEKQKIFPNIKHSSFSEYLKEMRKKDLSSLPVWKDELYLEYHRGTYTTQAETKRFNRKSEVLLSNTEKISSLAFLLGRDYNQKTLKKAWEKVLMNQFHDILPGSSINPVYKDAKESYLEAHKMVKKELLEGLKSIAPEIDTSKVGKGIPLLVFNSLSWDRDGVVRANLPPNLPEEVKVLSLSGEEIPSQILKSKKGNILCFIAKGVPSLGYSIYRIQEGKGAAHSDSLKVDETTLENRFYRITLHPESGNIISIFDKLAKREILAPYGQGNQLQLMEDIPSQWDAWNIGYTGRQWELDKAQSIEIAQNGPVIASLKVNKNYLGLSKARREPTTDFPSSFFSQEIILYEEIPRIDIQMNIDWWEDHVLLKVAFPVDVKNESATYEIPYAFVKRPTARNTGWEKARFEVPAIRWADLSEEKYGVSLLNESKYGYDIKDNVMRLTLLRSPLWPDPMADRGKHQLAYALYPHKGNWKDGDTVQRGYEFNYPLLAYFTDSHTGKLPASHSFFRASPSNIVLSAIKKAEDRESLILRLYESEGEETEALVEFFRKPKKIYELDLMENRLDSVPFGKNSLSLKFGKSEIKTIELVY